MRKKPTRPEDLLPDNKDTTEFQGVTIRKGTVGTTLMNMDLRLYHFINERPIQRLGLKLPQEVFNKFVLL